MGKCQYNQAYLKNTYHQLKREGILLTLTELEDSPNLLIPNTYISHHLDLFQDKKAPTCLGELIFSSPKNKGKHFLILMLTHATSEYACFNMSLRKQSLNGLTLIKDPNAFQLRSVYSFVVPLTHFHKAQTAETLFQYGSQLQRLGISAKSTHQILSQLFRGEVPLLWLHSTYETLALQQQFNQLLNNKA